MSIPRDAIPVPFPIPRGMNRKDALLSMPDLDSPWILNIDCENQFDRVRNGVVIHSTIASGVSSGLVLGLGVYATRGATGYDLFAYVQDADTGVNKIYDVSAAAEAEVGAGTILDDIADEAYPLRFNGRLYFQTEWNVGGGDIHDVIYNGSAWALGGFTVGGNPLTGSRVGTSYKGRPYFAASTNLYYPTTVGAVTGALNTLDLSSVFESSGAIAFLANLSAPGDRSTEMYLCIGNQAGEILVYGGDYPASSTWSLVSRFQIPPLLGFNTIIPYNNDIWIMTQSGIVSLRDLFTQREDEVQALNVSDDIDDYWIKLTKQISAGFYGVPAREVSGCFWPEKNKILILMPGHIDVSGTYNADVATMFAYNCMTKKWSIYSLSNLETDHLGGMTYFNDGVYFFTNNVVMTLSQTVFKDETYNSAGSYSAYAYSLHSAYFSIDDVAKGKRVVGVEPIVKTDFGAGKFGVKVASDAGRVVSGATTPTLQDGYNAPYCPIGADGTYLQYRIEGTSDVDSTDGLELYAVTAITIPQGLR